MKRLRGFTLVEMIMVIVITGIVAGMVAVFIATPVKGYVDTVRRAGLTDTADLALKRMAMEIRAAVPNSVRVDSTGKFIEFIPARTGGRYCSDAETCTNQMVFGTSTLFDVLGPATDAAGGEFLVIYNTGQTDLNAYLGSNLRVISGTGTTTSTIAFSGTPFTYASPSNRFQIVPITGPVTFACETVGGSATGTGLLTRYSGYNVAATFKDPQPITGMGIGALLADNLSACGFIYDTVTATNGLVSLSLTLTREGESITLFHQVHVDNMP